MKSKDAGIAIIVALIGLCGVLGAAAINNWGKLFPPAPTSAPPNEPQPGGETGKPVSTCSGREVGGFCWYFGEENASCNAVCAAHAGYHEATRTYAGSDGSAGNCRTVLTALNIPLDDFFETAQGGLGCFALQTTSGNYHGYWDTQPTTAAATYVTPGRRRICACQH
jgi:hypothetical protein